MPANWQCRIRAGIGWECARVGPDGEVMEPRFTGGTYQAAMALAERWEAGERGPTVEPGANGERLRAARLAARLSLRPAAELLELSPFELNELENGRGTLPEAEWITLLNRLEAAAPSNTGAA